MCTYISVGETRMHPARYMQRRVMYDGSNIFGWRGGEGDVLGAMSIYSRAMHKSSWKMVLRPHLENYRRPRLKSWGVKKFRRKEFRATLKAPSCTYSAASNASQLWYSLYVSYAIQYARIIISNALSTWVSRNQSCHTYCCLYTEAIPAFCRCGDVIARGSLRTIKKVNCEEAKMRELYVPLLSI